MKRLLIFDISSFIFRAYYAIRPLNAPDGTPVNSIYGVMNMLINAMDDLAPTHVFIAQDSKGPSFRHEIYDAYKANRGAPPDDLIPQFPLIDEMLDVLKIPKLKLSKYEADDIIGSAVHSYQNTFDEILIASSDKDLMQFVTKKVKMVDTMKGKIFGPSEVEEKMGVAPEMIVDYLSLVGDSSDNIPGVKGIGAKGASKLLKEYGGLDEIFNNIDKISNKRVLNGLTNHKEDAYLSKKLVQIKCDLKLEEDITKLKYEEIYNGAETLEFLERLNFKRLISKLNPEVSPRAKTKKTVSKETAVSEKENLESESKDNSVLENNIIFIKDQAEAFLSKIKKNEKVYLSLQNTMLYLSYKNIRFSYEDINFNFLEALVSKSIIIESFQAKEILKISMRKNIKIKATLTDLALLYFNVSPHRKNSLENLIKDFGADNPELKVKEAKDLNQVSLLSGISDKLINEIKNQDLEGIAYDIDLKLNPILAEMENCGLRVNKAYLTKLRTDYEKELKKIERKIYKLADFECNLKSPKQVSELLFEKLQLPVIKKTKTGYSTDSSVLNKLAQSEVSEVPGLLLRFREIDKLLSTYINALPELIHPETKRVHTRFNQTVASTGRLSSENPNLQNIPVKSEMGRKIRKAFIPAKDHIFIAADYSQVELRILAHFCKDEVMLNAFKNDIDIHTQVASEVFGVAVADMTPDIRSKAKAINFGLIYGQSSFGLSESLGIDRSEASEYIAHYFQRFSKVKSFLDSLKEDCEKTGYSITYHGRKRPIPEIHAQNRTLKSVGERMSINSPIQGTAADIIKIAMINVDKKMKKKKLKSQMILQVHDELIFEVPLDEKESMMKLIKEEMENAVSFDVPLKVDINTGSSWFDLK